MQTLINNPVFALTLIVLSTCMIVILAEALIDKVKSLIAPAVVEVVAPARGVILRAESETSVITLVHTGGDNYEINNISKIINSGYGVYRKYEHRAKSHFDFYCSMSNARIVN